MVLSPISIPGNNYNDIQSRGYEFYKNPFSLGKKHEKMNRLRGRGIDVQLFVTKPGTRPYKELHH